VQLDQPLLQTTNRCSLPLHIIQQRQLDENVVLRLDDQLAVGLEFEVEVQLKVQADD